MMTRHALLMAFCCLAMTTTLRAQVAQPAAIRPIKDPMLAGVLSAIVPGAGHVYAARPVRGVAFFLADVFIGSQWLRCRRLESGATPCAMNAPMLLLTWAGVWAWNIVSASSDARAYNTR